MQGFDKVRPVDIAGRFTGHEEETSHVEIVLFSIMPRDRQVFANTGWTGQGTAPRGFNWGWLQGQPGELLAFPDTIEYLLSQAQCGQGVFSVDYGACPFADTLCERFEFEA